MCALVAPVAPATDAPVAPNAPAALTALTAVGDAASPSTATLNAPAVPAAYAETASSSTAAPAAPDSNGWMCPACNTKYSNSDDVCTTFVSGRQCNSTRTSGVPVGGKRSRTATQRLDVQNGAGQSYESGSGGAPPPGPRSGVAGGGGVQGNTASARGKGRAAAATPALERLDKVTWCSEDPEVPAGWRGAGRYVLRTERHGDVGGARDAS